MDLTLPVSIPDLAEPRLLYRENLCVTIGVRHPAKHLLSFPHLILITSLRGNGPCPSFPDKESKSQRGKGLEIESYGRGWGLHQAHWAQWPRSYHRDTSETCPCPPTPSLQLVPTFSSVPFLPLLSCIPHFWPCLTSSQGPVQPCPNWLPIKDVRPTA